MKKLLIIGIICVLCASLVYPGDDKPNSEQRTTNYESLIKQLGSYDFQKRESTQDELLQIGKKLIRQYGILKKAKDKIIELTEAKGEIEKFAQVIHDACSCKDPEIKMRANQIRQSINALTQLEIAFIPTRNRKAGTEYMTNIYVMDEHGENQKRLSTNETSDYNPVWDPAGIMIAFMSACASDSDGTKKMEICVMDADGKNRKRLTDNKAYDSQPTWNPDGTKIVFVSGRDGNNEIYVMDTDGKNQIRLTNNNTNDSAPVCSPDGTKIAFVTSQNNESEIYVMDAMGKNQIRLTEGRSPQWNTDSTKIAFALPHYENKKCIKTEICIIGKDGENLSHLTEGWSPQWSPDGTKISFIGKERNGIPYLCVIDADGKNQRKLVTEKYGRFSFGSPTWFPDGIKIVFERSEES